MMSCKETRGKFHSFSTLALDLGEWLLHVPATKETATVHIE